MKEFEFISNTKIYFGKEAHFKIGKIIKAYGFENVLFLYGKGSIKKNHLYDEIITSLNQEKIHFIERSGIEPNPKLSWIKTCKASLKNQKIDLILAVGGGSVIDSGKLLSHCLLVDSNPFDFNLGKVLPEKSIPLGVILTIAAAGSELSNSCVISNDEVTPFIKMGFNHDANRPLFAILNPCLTYSVSPYQTACGIVDMMMHTLERFMNENDECRLSSEFALGLLKTILHYGKIVMKDPQNEQARSELMLASSLSHNGLTGLGKKQFMRVHGLEHVLSGCYDEVTHGAGLAILWPAWCKYIVNQPKANALLTILAKELFSKDNAIDGIIELENFFKEIKMPTRLSQLDLKAPLDIEKMALIYSQNKTKSIHDFVNLNYDAFIKIFEMAK